MERLDPVGAPRRWALRQPGSWILECWPAIAAWLFATTAILIAVSSWGFDAFSSATWVHWDSFNYLDQARHGPSLGRCSYAPTLWCGNSGWFPGYPRLVAGARALGFPTAGAAVAITWGFGLATIILLWRTFLRRQLTYGSVVALLYAAFTPGIAFYYGVYPLALFSFCTLFALWLLARDRLVLAGVAGALAIFAYQIGLALIPGTAIWLLVSSRRIPFRERLERATLTAGLMSTGLIAVLAYDWIETGHWNAYRLSQSTHSHVIHEPLAYIIGAFNRLDFNGEHLPGVQTIVMSIVLVAVIASVALRRGRDPSAESLLVIWALLAWLLTSMPGNLEPAREDGVFLPLAVLVGRLPRAVSAAIVVAVVELAGPIAVLYVQNKLP